MAGNAPSDAIPARAVSEGVMITVRLTPKSVMDEVTGVECSSGRAPALRARVRALPSKGKANEALAALIAEWLDVPKSACEVAAGGKSRSKQALIRGDPDALMQRIRERLARLMAGNETWPTQS